MGIVLNHLGREGSESEQQLLCCAVTREAIPEFQFPPSGDAIETTPPGLHGCILESAGSAVPRVECLGWISTDLRNPYMNALDYSSWFACLSFLWSAALIHHNSLFPREPCFYLFLFFFRSSILPLVVAGRFKLSKPFTHFYFSHKCSYQYPKSLSTWSSTTSSLSPAWPLLSL